MENKRAIRFINHLNYLVPQVKSFGVLSWENINKVGKKENKSLENLLRSGAFSFRQVKGIYGNLKNPFFVYNIILTDLLENARYGEQHQVISGKLDKNNAELLVIECSTGNTIGSRKIHHIDNLTYKIDETGEKFSVPFFDDEAGNIRLISKNFIFQKKDFPNRLVKEINDSERYAEMFNEDKTAKHRWMSRGIYLSKISKLLQ